MVQGLQGQVGTVIGIPGGKARGLARPAGEWNTFDIDVVGDLIRTRVNGQTAYEARGLKIPSGHVGLQVEVPQGGQFQIRALSIIEYGARSLFDGQSLAGWEGAGGPATACWKASNGALMCTGDKGPWLRSEQPFADFHLKLEYQVAPGGNSGLYVRVPANGSHHRDKEQQPPAGFEVQILDDAAPKYAKLKPYQYSASVYDIAGANPRTSKPAGQWNTLELNCLGQHITSIHNGVVVVDIDADSHPAIRLRQVEGFLGLQNHSTVVRYRNLRLGPAQRQLVP
ncbi:MAG: family 16 glycoside hydrolase [Planctomycetaceae bacterium]